MKILEHHGVLDALNDSCCIFGGVLRQSIVQNLREKVRFWASYLQCSQLSKGSGACWVQLITSFTKNV